MDEAEPLLEAIAIQSVAGISYIEQDIVEESLEGRDRGSSLNQQSGESIGRGETECQDLASMAVSVADKYRGHIEFDVAYPNTRTM